MKHIKKGAVLGALFKYDSDLQSHFTTLCSAINYLFFQKEDKI
jgi:hypothetical protein